MTRVLIANYLTRVIRLNHATTRESASLKKIATLIKMNVTPASVPMAGTAPTAGHGMYAHTRLAVIMALASLCPPTERDATVPTDMWVSSANLPTLA